MREKEIIQSLHLNGNGLNNGYLNGKANGHPRRNEWKVNASVVAKNTFNPIRDVMETMTLTPNPNKKMISLSLGDPTVYKNLNPATEVVDAVRNSLMSGSKNGYGPSTGFIEARQAVADYVSVPGAEITADDVILCSGCSCALDIAISTMADAGQNILVPRPGFPIYTTLSAGQEIETREYDLLPNQDWEADLEQMEALIDQNTAAIVVNSPSNPCGSVFSVPHLKNILAIAEKYKVPIIADEIYEHFVFPGETYVPIASLTTTVPVLSCSGLTKRFLVPGWRLGWIIIYDRNHVFDQEIRRGLMCMSQRIIGSNTFIQGALPTILKKTPKSFFENAINVIKQNAELAFKKLRNTPGKLLFHMVPLCLVVKVLILAQSIIPCTWQAGKSILVLWGNDDDDEISTFTTNYLLLGLLPIMPRGAMYMMVKVDMDRFPQFTTDLQFIEKLVSEESVHCMPGKCFNYPGYMRLVLTLPINLLTQALDRIHSFCR